MASIRVEHTIGNLAADCRKIAVSAKPKLRKIVATNVREGREQAKMYARESSGPHGKNYYKRITSEMTGPLEGEFGPHGDVVGNAVGAGWRNGPPNTDLEKTQDVIGRQFADDVSDEVDGWFWP